MTHDNLHGVKLDNLKYIKDPTKKFKYLFPFYRMSIETLDYKLQHLYKTRSVVCSDTDLIHINEFKKVFKTTPAWN